MSAGYAKSVRNKGHAPTAVICYDQYHAVALGTKALDAVRSAHWQETRRADEQAAKRFKGARWCLRKNPESLDDDQVAVLWRLDSCSASLRSGYGSTRRDAMRRAFRRPPAGQAVADQPPAVGSMPGPCAVDRP